MSIENIVEKAELLDCYGMLLTARQRECLDLYYNENLTLAEIAEYFHISRQCFADICFMLSSSMAFILLRMDTIFCCITLDVFSRMTGVFLTNIFPVGDS